MSLRQIAKSAGVSATTVSRVLNNHPQVSRDVRERVMAVVNESRYVASVGRRSTTNIALVYTGEATIRSPFDSALIEGLMEEIESQGNCLMVMTSRAVRPDQGGYSQQLLNKGVRGCILRADHRSHDTCIAIGREGFPCVVVGERIEGEGLVLARTDSRDSSRAAIQHLVDLGHRRIAMCVNVVEDSDHDDRVDSYRATLEANGLKVDPRLIMNVSADREGGAQALRQIVAMPAKPTAVFLADPMASVGLLAYARRVGVSVPRDLSVVGFDDSDLRYTVSPRMTSVCQDARQLGLDAAVALKRIMEDPSQSGQASQLLPSWFEVHDSTGPPPGA